MPEAGPAERRKREEQHPATVAHGCTSGLFLAGLLIGYGLIEPADWLDVPTTPVPASPALFAVSASSGALAAVDPLACADAVAVELRLRHHDRELRRLRARLDAFGSVYR